MSTFEISLQPEYTIDKTTRGHLRRLLEACFPEFFHSRIYHKQLPHARLLGRLDGMLVAQVGIDHRVIRVGDQPLTILGIIDLCVASEHRNFGYGSCLLESVEELGRKCGVDSVVLLADDHRLYHEHGYKLLNRHCIFLGIDEHQSLGQCERDLDNCLMVKPLANAPWPAGEVDFLGYLF